MESRIGFRDLPKSLKAYSTLGVNPIFRETYGMVSAGFTYTGQRFEDNFADFIKKYGFRDMYSCGFYPFESLEEYWAYWSRYVFINRYRDSDNGTYKRLFALVKDKDYFVLTTNVDHQFQKAGFDKHRLFYTQGDYGLFQCSGPCHNATYDNEKTIRDMVARQTDMKIPTGLIPHCPVCKKPMTMNLRADDTFVQDKGSLCLCQLRGSFRTNGNQRPLCLYRCRHWAGTRTIIRQQIQLLRPT